MVIWKWKFASFVTIRYCFIDIDAGQIKCRLSLSTRARM